MGWNLSELHRLVDSMDSYVVTEEHNCLVLTNQDGLEGFLTVSGDQILVESLLFPKRGVKDVTALNEQILRTHKLFPLTAIEMTKIDGEDYYAAFGALSSQSKEESIIIEIDFLFKNVQEMLEAYQDALV